MNILVTGHAGYVGSVMTRFLSRRGHRVHGLDAGWFHDCTFEPVPEEEAIPLLGRDVRDVQPTDLEGFDAVVHLAALSNDPLGAIDPELTLDINLRATLRLAEAARAAGVSRFLFASSCSIYGAAEGEGLLDEEAPLRPVTAYGRSKVESEAGLRKLADDSFSPVFLRNATVYGVSPRLRLDLVLNNLVAAAVTSGRVLLLSDGSPWRPVLHVEDMCRAFVAALEAPREAVHAEAFNVGLTSENYTVRQLAEIVVETVPGSQLRIAPDAGPDKRTYRVGFSKIARALPDLELQWDARRGARELFERLTALALTAEDFAGSRFVRLRRIRELMEHGALDHHLRWVAAHTGGA